LSAQRTVETAGDGTTSNIPGFSAFQALITGSTTEFSNLVERGPSNFLLAFGSTIMAVALFMQVDLEGYHLADLATSEFIATMITGLLMIVLGSALRLAQYRSWEKFERVKLEQGAKLLQPAAEAGKALVEGVATSEPPKI